MIQSRSLVVAGVFLAASIAIAAWGYAVLPAGAGLPYNTFGGQTAHMAKAYAVALMPAVSAVVLACMIIAPLRAPNLIGPEGNSGPYGLLMMGLAAVFCVTEFALVQRMANPAFDVVRLVFLAVAALLVVVGNYLGKVRYNAVFGLKTPWTLKDERVWDKTHRVVARLMVVGGAALVPACLFITDLNILVPTMIALTAGPALFGIGYSRRAWLRERRT